MDPLAPGFAPGVDAWRRGLPAVRNQVRQELVARQLAAHLPDDPTTAIDLGCGQGTQAIRLARAGHQVIGIDLSPELLAVAEAAATAEPEEVRRRLQFRLGDLNEAGSGDPAGMVCCHGVVMYLPTLEEGVAAVVGAARRGGLVSVLTWNRASLAMRAGMMADWVAARDSFDGRYYDNRLGLLGVRADEPDEVALALAGAGAERIAWYGVRLFTDHWGDVEVPADGTFDDLLAAEEEAGRRDPYRTLAAFTHTLAIRSPR